MGSRYLSDEETELSEDQSLAQVPSGELNASEVQGRGIEFT